MLGDLSWYLQQYTLHIIHKDLWIILKQLKKEKRLSHFWPSLISYVGVGGGSNLQKIAKKLYLINFKITHFFCFLKAKNCYFNYPSTTTASGALLLTDSIPLSLDSTVSYDSLVPMIWLLAAFRLNINLPELVTFRS